MTSLLFELLNATLCVRHLNAAVFEDASESEWQHCYDQALKQNVLAMIFPAVSSLPKELRPSFTLWSKWMAYTQSIVDQSQYKQKIIKRIGSWLVEEGLTTTLLKGFSLSFLYPDPRLREFCDIDIFSGQNYNAINACFAKHGVTVDSVDGHHAYLNVDGVSVEHHFAFHNTRVKQGLVGPEKYLQQLVVEDCMSTAIPGIYFPNPAFTALFVGWHAYEHFLQEKIQLRHVTDWALALRRLSELEAKTVNDIKKKNKWGEFVNTLTAIAVSRLQLPQEWFSYVDYCGEPIKSESLVRKVWNDIMYSPPIPQSKNNNYRRILIAKRILKNGWKYKEFADFSASRWLCEEFLGLILNSNK